MYYYVLCISNCQENIFPTLEKEHLLFTAFDRDGDWESKDSETTTILAQNP